MGSKISLSKILEYLIYLLLFLLPWSTRYIFKEKFLKNEFWEYGSYSLYVLDVLIGIIILIFFLAYAQKTIKQRLSPLLLLLIVFWVINFFNLYWTQDKELSFYCLIRLTEALILFYIILNIKLDFKKIALAFVSAGVIQSILGIIQFVAQKTLTNKWLGMAEHLPEILGTQVVAGKFGRVLRVYGSFPHPNILGMFLVIAIILTTYLILTNTKIKPHRLIYISCIIILQIGLMMTFSRQAWLTLCLELLILLILYKPKKIIIQLIGVILLTALVFVLIYSSLVLNRFNFNEPLESYSLEQRAERQTEAFSIIKKYWITGIGLGTYTLKTSSEPVHNIYLLILSELGLLGLTCFILILGFFFYYFIKNTQQKSSLKINTSAIIIIVLSVLGAFDHYLWTLFPFNLLFWLWLAIFSVEKQFINHT